MKTSMTRSSVGLLCGCLGRVLALLVIGIPLFETHMAGGIIPSEVLLRSTIDANTLREWRLMMDAAVPVPKIDVIIDRLDSTLDNKFSSRFLPFMSSLGLSDTSRHDLRRKTVYAVSQVLVSMVLAPIRLSTQHLSNAAADLWAGGDRLGVRTVEENAAQGDALHQQIYFQHLVLFRVVWGTLVIGSVIAAFFAKPHLQTVGLFLVLLHTTVPNFLDGQRWTWMDNEIGGILPWGFACVCLAVMGVACSRIHVMVSGLVGYAVVCSCLPSAGGMGTCLGIHEFWSLCLCVCGWWVCICV